MKNMTVYLYNLATDRYKGLSPAILKFFLFILSIIYGLAVEILIFVNGLKRYRPNCKVISVGNITLGGTGKTALVEFIANYLRQQGRKVAILSRGYKRKITDYGLRITNYENMGDEPYMLQGILKDVPIIVDADRVRAANRAIREYAADTVILDDGFQQWKLKKDLDIVTIDATCPFGNRHLVPRGILREGFSSLRRADMFVLTKTNINTDTENIKNTLHRFNPSGLIIESIHQPQGFYNLGNPEDLLNTAVLKGKTATLFSGIADPDSFENLITQLGINVGLSFRFPDHHNYTKEDLDKIIHASEDKNIGTVITTEKDAARIDALAARQAGSLQLLVLRIGLILKDEQRFYNRLLKLYSL